MRTCVPIAIGDAEAKLKAFAFLSVYAMGKVEYILRNCVLNLFTLLPLPRCRTIVSCGNTLNQHNIQ